MTTNNVLKEIISPDDAETMVHTNADIWLSIIGRYEGDRETSIDAAYRLIKGTYTDSMANAVIRVIKYKLGTPE